MTKKVQEWSEQLLDLANIATTQPHATFTAFGHGYVHKITYLSRVTPNIGHLLQPLEDIIQSRLIPAWTGRAPPNAIERDLFKLPARLGGLGIVNLPSRSSSEFSSSMKISSPLIELILKKSSSYPWDVLEAQLSSKQAVHKERQEACKSAMNALVTSLNDSQQHALALA